jgi:uncharacterized protein Yka (UPF0111/DUF47 family)
MQFQAWVRALLPNEEQFYGLLEAQADVAHQAAEALARFGPDGAGAEKVRADVQALEHKADAIVHTMEDALARTYVTPMDREDIHQLSSELDDIVDITNLAARACHLYGLEAPTPPMAALMKTLVEATGVVKSAVARLRRHEYGGMLEDTRVIRRLEKEGDAVFRNAVSALFHDASVTAKVLMRDKEVLEDIERAIDRCDQVAGTLTNLAVKHG